MSTAQFIRATMTHRCTIERNNAATPDPDGHPGTTDWDVLASAQACFLWTSSGREAVAPDRTVVVDQVHLMFPLGTDVTPKDRINGVADKAGNTLLVGVLNIRSVLPHHDHLEAQLERAA